MKFSGENFDVGLVQEPYCLGNRVKNIGQCDLLYDRGGRGPPKTAIAFRRGLNYVPLTQSVTRDLVVAVVDTDMDGLGKKLVFCSGYHDG